MNLKWSNWYLLVLPIIFFLLLFHTLYSFRVVDVSINRISDISLTTFTLHGSITVVNKGLFPITIEQFTATLDPLGSVNVTDLRIPARSNYTFPILMTVSLRYLSDDDLEAVFCDDGALRLHSHINWRVFFISGVQESSHGSISLDALGEFPLIEDAVCESNLLRLLF